MYGLLQRLNQHPTMKRRRSILEGLQLGDKEEFLRSIDEMTHYTTSALSDMLLLAFVTENCGRHTA